MNNDAPLAATRDPREQDAINKLMGLAVFGEAAAAKTYGLMGRLRPEHEPMMRKFARMEGVHAGWFHEACVRNGVEPDRDFANAELGYLLSQVQEHFAAEDFDALAVVQGFIVESLAIATYEPFLKVADQYPGTRDAFHNALEEEKYHVEWIRRYFRLRFCDRETEFLELTERVNVQGIDCVGGSMMNIARLLDTIGMSGADCAGSMMDGYAQLLEDVGLPRKQATKNVVKMFMPLIRKYRHDEQAAVELAS